MINQTSALSARHGRTVGTKTCACEVPPVAVYSRRASDHQYRKMEVQIGETLLDAATQVVHWLSRLLERGGGSVTRGSTLAGDQYTSGQAT
jgi:hypothetical protein